MSYVKVVNAQCLCHSYSKLDRSHLFGLSDSDFVHNQWEMLKVNISVILLVVFCYGKSILVIQKFIIFNILHNEYIIQSYYEIYWKVLSVATLSNLTGYGQLVLPITSYNAINHYRMPQNNAILIVRSCNSSKSVLN